MSLKIDVKITNGYGGFEHIDTMWITRETDLTETTLGMYRCETGRLGNIYIQHEYHDGAWELVRRALEGYSRNVA